MKWTVLFHDEFAEEAKAFPDTVYDELAAKVRFISEFGPQLGRPLVDTLNGSKHANMKELRFNAADGVWRVAFAFDPKRQAVLLVAGDKSGGSSDKFYKRLIEIADDRFSNYLKTL